MCFEGNLQSKRVGEFPGQVVRSAQGQQCHHQNFRGHVILQIH